MVIEKSADDLVVQAGHLRHHINVVAPAEIRLHCFPGVDEEAEAQFESRVDRACQKGSCNSKLVAIRFCCGQLAGFANVVPLVLICPDAEPGLQDGTGGNSA